MNETEVLDVASSCGSLTELIGSPRYRCGANPAVGSTADQGVAFAPVLSGEGSGSRSLPESNGSQSGGCVDVTGGDDEASDSGGQTPDSGGQTPDSNPDSRDAEFGHRSRPDNRATGRFGTPAGLESREDVLGTVPDRQVLVVGDGIVGRTLTALLQRSGYEPVLATGTGRSVKSTVVGLGPDALAGLEKLGLAGHIRDRGTRIESVVDSWPSASESWTRPVSSPRRTDRAELVVVASAAVRRTLAAECPIERARTDRPIAHVRSAGDGIGVEFGDGVREYFDVVVDTVGTATLQRTSADAGPEHTLHQYERRFDLEGAASNELRDVWLPGGLVQSVPYPGSSETLVRITTGCDDASEPLERDSLGDQPGLNADLVSTVLTDVQPTTVQQGRFSDGQPPKARWGRGRMARCGASACPTAPATGCTVSFGVQDAVAFVAELSRCEQSSDAVVDAYATDRKRAFARASLQRKTATGNRKRSSKVFADPALRTLDAFRTIALESLNEPGNPSR